MSVDRRSFLQSSAAATAAALAWPGYRSQNQSDLAPIFAQIEKRHDEAVARLQEWIRQPSIAAENRGVNEGCDLTMRLFREAGFDQVTKIPTAGQPGIFAMLDAGAPRTLGLYFMYDVKQADPAEWSSPPWDAALVDRPGLGKVMMGRGAVNQKGPEATFLAALHAIRGAARKPPVNFVLVAEGEEEIGSPHFPQIVRRPEVQSALRKTLGIFMPSASQGLDGQVTMFLGAKGVIECELVSSGERWGRGPKKDIHSSNKARVDSPAWHLVEGLVGGYTGPGGKTILPHRAVAKLDLRLVPDMTAAESLAALKAHLAKRGFGDIEVNMTGGYDPTSTAADASLVKTQVAVYKRSGIDPVVLPRIAGSWPGYVFTGDPLRPAAGHFGLG